MLPRRKRLTSSSIIIQESNLHALLLCPDVGSSISLDWPLKYTYVVVISDPNIEHCTGLEAVKHHDIEQGLVRGLVKLVKSNEKWVVSNFTSQSAIKRISCFLNLPVWANFYSLTDLSMQQFYYFRQTSYIGLTQPRSQPKPVSTSQLGPSTCTSQLIPSTGFYQLGSSTLVAQLVVPQLGLSTWCLNLQLVVQCFTQ